MVQGKTIVLARDLKVGSVYENRVITEVRVLGDLTEVEFGETLISCFFSNSPIRIDIDNAHLLFNQPTSPSTV